MSSSPPATTSAKPTVEQVRSAAQKVGSVLGSTKYAVVGGAACSMLGSSRVTEDVDFVVPRNGTVSVKNQLKAEAASFSVDPRTRHTYFQSTPPVEIEVLAPPALFKEAFDESTPTISVQGVEVLKPALILNAKCRSILGRANQSKKDTDAQDIMFLLGYLAKTNTKPSSQEVPNATKQFVDYFVGAYHCQELWEKAGYDLETGELS